jgi:hypothetical protein
MVSRWGYSIPVRRPSKTSDGGRTLSNTLGNVITQNNGKYSSLDGETNTLSCNL